MTKEVGIRAYKGRGLNRRDIIYYLVILCGVAVTRSGLVGWVMKKHRYTSNVCTKLNIRKLGGVL